MMDPYGLYPVIAQIAATFAGFGSLASGLGQRRGDDARLDAYRLGLMLFATLSATLLGLLPAMLMAVSVPPALAVRISAAIAAVALLINLPLNTRQVLKLRQRSGFNVAAGVANTFCLLTALAAFLLSAFAIWPSLGAGVYLVGLMGMLASSILMFSRVIRSILRPHSGSGEREL